MARARHIFHAIVRHFMLLRLRRALQEYHNVDNVISLWPRDTSHTTKLSDKRMVGVNTIHQIDH